MLILKNGEEKLDKLRFPPFEPVVYETVRTYKRHPFMLSEHLKRFEVSAKIVGISFNLSKSELEGKLVNICENFNGECYFKIYLAQNGDYFIEASEISKRAENVCIAFTDVRKAPADVIPPQLKIINRTDILLARLKKGKFYDVIMLNKDGCVAEGSFSNVFMVKGGSLITPSLKCDVLNGITRQVVIDLAKENGIEVKEKCFSPEDLLSADEIFLTHTSQGIVSVSKLEGEVFKKGRVTEELIEAFENFAVKEC